MNSYIEAALLGSLQGATEFLPVSSSAHLILASWVLDGKPIPLSLNIAFHLGTTVAVLCYFWRDWLKLSLASFAFLDFKGKVTKEIRGSQVLLASLVIGSIPAGVIGILWEKKIEQVFHRPEMTLIPLALVGILLWLVDLKSKKTKNLADINLKSGFLVGLAQACALIPGVSRSGSTILCGRLLQFDRESAAKFSFLLGTPAMLGAAVLKWRELALSFDDPIFYIGVSFSFLVGLAAIEVLLRMMQRFSLFIFAAYRVALAVLIFALI